MSYRSPSHTSHSTTATSHDNISPQVDTRHPTRADRTSPPPAQDAASIFDKRGERFAVPRVWPSQLGLGSGPVRPAVRVYPVGYAGFVPGLKAANLHGAPWRDLLTPRGPPGGQPGGPSPRRLLVMQQESARESHPGDGGGGGGGGGGTARRPLSARQLVAQAQARTKLQKRASVDLYSG
jgi:hypothetical protein